VADGGQPRSCRARKAGHVRAPAKAWQGTQAPTSIVIPHVLPPCLPPGSGTGCPTPRRPDSRRHGAKRQWTSRFVFSPEEELDLWVGRNYFPMVSTGERTGDRRVRSSAAGSCRLCTPTFSRMLFTW